MEKIAKIKGMNCAHCVNRIEKTLNAIPGVTATANLKDKSINIKMQKEISDQELKDTVKSINYEIIEIKTL